MVNKFATIMCSAALFAENAQAQQSWNASHYQRGDQVNWVGKVWECREWPMSDFCHWISLNEPHEWIAWRRYTGEEELPADHTNPIDCETTDLSKSVEYSVGDVVCSAGSNHVFQCKKTPCTSLDFVETNYTSDQFWKTWSLMKGQANHIDNDNDNTQPDDDTTPDDNTNPNPEPSGDYWQAPDKIVMPDNGPWTGGDWVHQESGLKCENGVVSAFTDEAKQRFRSNGINFPIPLVRTDMPESNPENVQRAMRVLTRDKWEYLVSLRDGFYTYDNFMQGLAAFPGICSDQGEGYAHLTKDEVCAREMATLFAHFSQEVGAHWSGTGGIAEEWRQSLYIRSEESCTLPNWGGDYCNYYPTWDEWSIRDNAYPRRDSSQSYHGRGPLQMSWNYQYGPFSKQLFGDQYVLLDWPERIITDGHGVETWLAAFWFYSTPQPPKPSMHEVATGLWVPNQQDIQAGNYAGFGATTNIINGYMECGYPNSQKADWREEYYQGTSSYFNVDISSEVTNCEATNTFSNAGTANQELHYFDQRWDGVRQCQPVWWMTPYSVYTDGDYKRCVEHFYG